MYSIRTATKWDYGSIEQLIGELFPGEYVGPIFSREWWLVRDMEGNVAGFAGLQKIESEPFAFLCLAGVRKDHRGQGLQKRLIRVRVRRARAMGLQGAITYTVSSNPASSNSLIACGFKLYEPDHAWVGREGVLYFRKDF